MASVCFEQQKKDLLRETQLYLLCPWGSHFNSIACFEKCQSQKYLSIKHILSCFSPLPQIATYTSSSSLSWRIVETGDLPSARSGLRAAVVENVLFVSGGHDGDELTAILSWDPVQEKWTHAGDTKVARDRHAAVAIPLNAIECAAVP